MAEICGTTPTGENVAQEDVGVTGERHHAFLNARAAGVVEADDGSADAHGHVHHLDDLGGVGFGERAAEDGEVLSEDEDETAFDASVAGDEAVAEELLLVHAEVVAAVGDELVGLFEGAFVEEELDALAGGHLALLALRGDAGFASTGLGEGVAALQFGQFLLKVHAGDYKQRGEGCRVTDEHCGGKFTTEARRTRRKLEATATTNELDEGHCHLAKSHPLPKAGKCGAPTGLSLPANSRSLGRNSAAS